MNKEGFVPASLIATFNRLKRITQDLKLIIDCCKMSTKLETKDDIYVSLKRCPVCYLGVDFFKEVDTFNY